MRKIKIEAYVDIDDEFDVEIDDDWTKEDIDHEVNFFVLERLHVSWEFVN